MKLCINREKYFTFVLHLETVVFRIETYFKYKGEKNYEEEIIG